MGARDGSVDDATAPFDASAPDASTPDASGVDATVSDGAPADGPSAEGGATDADSSAALNDGGAGQVAYAYVGTFLGGLWGFAIDTATGQPQQIGDAALHTGTVYGLAADPNASLLYGLDGTAAIRGYRMGDGGELTALQGFPMATNTPPSTIAIDQGGVYAYVGAGDGIHVYEIIAASGALQEVQNSPFARDTSPYYLAVSPSGRSLYAMGAGIRGYTIAADGTLTELAVDAGVPNPFGALVLHPSGAFLYSSGGGVYGWRVDPTTGALSPLPGSPFSTDVSSDTGATDLAFDSTGRFGYATSFATGHLTEFDVDAATGFLTPRAPAKSSGAYSVAVDPGGSFVLVGNDDEDAFSIFRLDPTTGALTPSTGSPFPGTGLQPEPLVVRLPR
jgi:6-phosphogluconolactonase (cycloisomerase 2 family)